MNDIDFVLTQLRYAEKQLQEAKKSYIDDVALRILPVLLQEALKNQGSVDVCGFVAYDAYKLAEVMYKQRKTVNEVV